MIGLKAINEMEYMEEQSKYKIVAMREILKDIRDALKTKPRRQGIGQSDLAPRGAIPFITKYDAESST